MDTIVNIFPSNFISPMVEANMLQIIVMALLLGFAIIMIGEEKSCCMIVSNLEKKKEARSQRNEAKR